MKPLRISRKQFFVYQANGLWFYLLAVRQVIVPVIVFLYIYPALSWYPQELLIGGLVYYIVMAVLFFLRKKAFMALYIVQAAAVTALLFFLLYTNQISQNAKLLGIFILADISFIVFMFTSRQAAVAFQTRRLEITDQDTPVEDWPATRTRGGRLKNRLISAAISAVIVAVVISVQHASPNVPARPTPSYLDEEQIQQQVLQEIYKEQSSLRPYTSATAPALRTVSPQKSARPAPLPDYRKYDVLRRSAAAPAEGAYDPLKLTYDPSCMGEDMDVILHDLSAADYTNNGIYEFYPKLDYLGLGWETNRVFMSEKDGKLFSLKYNTQSPVVNKQVEFLYAAETMYDQLADIYGNPTSSKYTDSAGKMADMTDMQKKLLAMRKGEPGTCSFEWDLTGVRILLDFTNQYQGPKSGRFELAFESK